MPRRGENIYKRKDGRYEGRYIKGRSENGKARFGYIYSYSYAEVKKALSIAKAGLHGSTKTIVIGKGTLSEFLQYWLENIIRDSVKPSTYARYYERVKGHIIPAVGHLKLSEITPEHAKTFIGGLGKKGLAPATIKSITGVLNSAMKKACEMRAASSNPFANITLPEQTAQKKKPLDRPSQIALEQMAQKAQTGTELAVFLSLYTGMRIGELCALRWNDIDLESGLITVHRTMQRIRDFSGGGMKTKLVETTPKSKTSNRVIPLSSGIISLLKRSYENAEPESYVISGSDKKIEPRLVRARFATLARKTGLDINFHILRHTFATRCLESNFDAQTLAELLGHSNANVTMSVYAHSVLSHKRELVQRMEILS